MALKDKDPTALMLGLFAISAGGYVLYRLFRSTPDDDAITSQYELFTDKCKDIDLDNLSFQDGFYYDLADTIHNAIWNAYGGGGLFENDAAIYDALSQMQTTEDYRRLYCVYGVRGPSPSWWPGLPKNLTVSINEYLDNHLKEQLNAEYEAAGIDIHFIVD